MLLEIGFDNIDRRPVNPLVAKPAGFVDRFNRELDAFRATEQAWSEQSNYYEAYERVLEDVAKVSGQRLINPYSVPDGPSDMPFNEVYNPESKTRAEALTDLETVLNTLRQEHPELPDPNMIRQKADDDAKALYDQARIAEAGSTGFLADVGGFAGTMTGAISDPVNLATLPIGGTARMTGGLGLRMIKQFGVEAAIGSGTQSLIEVSNADFREHLGIEGDSAFNILAAGIGGGLFGLAGRGVVDGYRLLRGEGMTLDELDAIRVADRYLSDVESNPLPRQDAEIHAVNMDQAEAAVSRGQRAAPQSQSAPRVAREGQAQTTGRVYTATGRAVDTETQVVEASSLITSNLSDMQTNPVFPAELQPRDRTRASAETQVQDIAANLEPERLGSSPDAATGAPIVGPHSVVESGNGRTMAILRAYQNGQGDAYRGYVEAQGFDTAGMTAPVLVRRRTTQLTPEDRVSFVKEANTASTLSMSAAEQALADATLVNRIADLYEGGEVDLAQNRKFVNAFVKGLSKSDEGAMTQADGSLSVAGKRRIEGGLLAAAYGDEAPNLIGKLLESTNNDIKAIGGALQDVAGRWSVMRKNAREGIIAPHMDITADLIAAVRVVEKARAGKHKVADLMAQGEMFNEGLGDNTKALLASFFRDHNYARAAGRKSIADRLAGYLDEAEKSRPGTDIFGAQAAPANDVLRATDPRRGQLDMIARNAEASEKLIDDVDSDTAAFVDAQRLAATTDPEIDTPDGARKASDMLDEAEDDAFAAELIAKACIAGQDEA